jgi:hypothetical protein
MDGEMDEKQKCILFVQMKSGERKGGSGGSGGRGGGKGGGIYPKRKSCSYPDPFCRVGLKQWESFGDPERVAKTRSSAIHSVANS